MCDLDDYGVPAILEAADTVTCRCNHEPVDTDTPRWHECDT